MLTLLALLLSLPPFVIAEETTFTENPPGKPLTLNDCVQEAITNNGTVRQARAVIEASKGAVIRAKAALYPILDTTTRIGYDNDDLFNTKENKEGDNNDFYERWQIDFEITKKLYDGTATRQAIAIAKLREDIAWNQYLEAINQAVYQTQIAFFEVLFTRRSLAVRGENFTRLGVITDRQKALKEGGRATRFDILRTEVKSTNELPLMEKTRSDIIAAEATLQQVMGRRFDPATLGRIAITGDFDAPAYHLDLDRLIAQAIQNSPLLTAAEKQIELSSRQEIAAHATKYPTFDLFAGGRFEKLPRGSDYWDNRTQFAFGVLGQWTIFDGFAAKGRIQEAKAFIERDTILREELVKTIQFNALRALLDLREAQAILAAGQSNLANAHESLDSLGKSLELGMTTQLDVYDANEDLLIAETLVLQARYNYRIAIASLERVTSTFVRNSGAPAKRSAK